MTLYDDLGGDEAISTALDHFYPKVLSDPILSRYFEGVDMAKLKGKALDFLTMAFGGPQAYDGVGLRAIHATPRRKGLDDSVFDLFMSHFGATLQELGVPDDKIAQAAAIAEGARADVLGE